MEKRAVTSEIVRFVLQTGRFLKKVRGTWVKLPFEEARQKVAHALQYRRRRSLKLLRGVSDHVLDDKSRTSKAWQDNDDTCTTQSNSSSEFTPIHAKGQTEPCVLSSSDELHLVLKSFDEDDKFKPSSSSSSGSDSFGEKTDHRNDLDSSGLHSLADILGFSFNQEPGANAEGGLTAVLSMYCHQERGAQERSSSRGDTPFDCCFSDTSTWASMQHNDDWNDDDDEALWLWHL